MSVCSTIGIAILATWIGAQVSPAAAQSFQERFSIVPKANAAEPNGPPLETQPSTEPGEPSGPGSSADAAKPEDRSGTHCDKRSAKRSFTGKASYYSYTTGKT